MSNALEGERRRSRRHSRTRRCSRCRRSASSTAAAPGSSPTRTAAPPSRSSTTAGRGPTRGRRLPPERGRRPDASSGRSAESATARLALQPLDGEDRLRRRAGADAARRRRSASTRRPAASRRTTRSRIVVTKARYGLIPDLVGSSLADARPAAREAASSSVRSRYAKGASGTILRQSLTPGVAAWPGPDAPARRRAVTASGGARDEARAGREIAPRALRRARDADPARDGDLDGLARRAQLERRARRASRPLCAPVMPSAWVRRPGPEQSRRVVLQAAALAHRRRARASARARAGAPRHRRLPARRRCSRTSGCRSCGRRTGGPAGRT